MKRKGKEGDFRSNIHRGGTAEKVKITPQERTTAVGAAKAMGLNFCGVDMLRSNHGPVVMEVNSSPGLEGMEKATGIDVADLLIDWIEKNAKPGKRSITVTPTEGMALLFFPGYLPSAKSPLDHVTAGGIDFATIHEALPVVEEKMIAQQWMWPGAYQLDKMPNNMPPKEGCSASIF